MGKIKISKKEIIFKKRSGLQMTARERRKLFACKKYLFILQLRCQKIDAFQPRYFNNAVIDNM